LLTLVRVAVVAASTLIWVPIGAKIGMSLGLSRYAQPVVQVLASFPAIPPDSHGHERSRFLLVRPGMLSDKRVITGQEDRRPGEGRQRRGRP